MDIADNILEHIKAKGQATTKELLDHLQAPESNVFRQLNRLTKNGQIIKEGRRPHVSYRLAPSKSQTSSTGLASASHSDPKKDPSVASLPQDDKKTSSGPLAFWCGKLNIDPQAVTKCHHEIYEWIFSSSYGLYRIPFGIVGKLADIVLWIAALKLVWFWKMRAVLKPHHKILLISLAVLLLAGFVYNRYSKARPSQASSQVSTSLPIADYQLKTLQEDLRLARDQIGELSEKNSGLIRQIEDAGQEKQQSAGQLRQSQEKAKDLEDQMVSLEEQLKKADTARKEQETQIKIKDASNSGLRQRVSELEQQNKSLQEQLNNERH